MALRRNRQEPAPEVERFDLGELRAGRARREADAIARIPGARQALAAASTPSAAAQYLPALDPNRPLTRAAFPPVELAAKHDDELARLLTEVNKRHGEAIRTALEWQSSTAGAAGFTAALNAATDEDELVRVIVELPARAFARALLAQRRALEADDAARSYAANAKRLHDELDKRTDELADEIGRLFEKARDDRSQRAYDDALERAAEWREAVALYRWLSAPTKAYRPPSPSAIPAEVAFRQWEASSALGYVVGIEVPLDAPDAPKPRQPGPIR